jgi:hypothetical protein
MLLWTFKGEKEAGVSGGMLQRTIQGEKEACVSGEMLQRSIEGENQPSDKEPVKVRI